MRLNHFDALNKTNKRALPESAFELGFKLDYRLRQCEPWSIHDGDDFFIVKLRRFPQFMYFSCLQRTTSYKSKLINFSERYSRAGDNVAWLRADVFIFRGEQIYFVSKPERRKLFY